MPLTCSCYDDPDWYCDAQDFASLDTKRGRRCASCHTWIKVGDVSLEFRCWRSPEGKHWEIEERIHGDEVPMPSIYHCESCADQYFNLQALGFCIDPTDNMMGLLHEYAEVYVPERRRYEKLMAESSRQAAEGLGNLPAGG